MYLAGNKQKYYDARSYSRQKIISIFVPRITTNIYMYLAGNKQKYYVALSYNRQKSNCYFFPKNYSKHIHVLSGK